jgi:hypothetical protein
VFESQRELWPAMLAEEEEERQRKIKCKILLSSEWRNRKVKMAD